MQTVIGCQLHGGRDLLHRDTGVRLKKLGQVASVFRGEVHHDDEGKATIPWHVTEEGSERGHATGGCAHAGGWVAGKIEALCLPRATGATDLTVVQDLPGHSTSAEIGADGWRDVTSLNTRRAREPTHRDYLR
jgi:hypothetical protein